MGIFLYNKKSAFAVLLGGSLANAVTLVSIYVVMIVFFGVDPVSFLVNQLTEQINAMTDAMSFMFQDQGMKQIELITQTLELIPMLTPMLIVAIGAMYALVIELVSTPILRRLGGHFPKWVPFRNWGFPKSIFWYYILTLLGVMFTSEESSGALYVVCINLYYMLELAMVIQGLSFIFFYFHSKKVHKSIPILISIFGMIIISPLISILGIIDIGFDLRKRMKKD